ncbi:MAG: integration host factor subunit alpha [Betaproteobacteria bacterium]|nr:integration host factor subunit alpha [Betaproteobacteria bacterium]
MTTTREHIARALHEGIGISKDDAMDMVAAFFEEIGASLQRGHTVKLARFGAFRLRAKKSRPGRNPRTKEGVPISARRVVLFRASNSLKAIVSQGHTATHGGVRTAPYPGRLNAAVTEASRN